MLEKTIGSLAIIIALFALLPSFIPGAMSIIGAGISLFAVFLAIFTTQKHMYWFYATLCICLIGLLLVNDLLRIWMDPIDLPLKIKLMAYLALSALLASLWKLALWLVDDKT